MDIVTLLGGRINMPDIRMVAGWASESRDNRDCLWRLAKSGDRRTGVNALWVMTHLPSSESVWLASLQDELADMLLQETDAARKRLLLQLLREQEYEPDSIRTDLLDYCLTKINSECEPYAVRAFSIYLAFRMCRFYPELVGELEERLSMLSFQSLSPGLVSARRRTLAAIRRLEKIRDTKRQPAMDTDRLPLMQDD